MAIEMVAIKVLIGFVAYALFSRFFSFRAAMTTTVFVRRLFFFRAGLGLAGQAQIDDRAAHQVQEGAIILEGTTMASKSSSEMPRATASTRKVVPFL